MPVTTSLWHATPSPPCMTAYRSRVHRWPARIDDGTRASAECDDYERHRPLPRGPTLARVDSCVGGT